MEEWLTLILMLIVSMLVALRRSHQRCRSSIDARRNLLRVDSNESDLKLSNLNPILAGELLILWSTVWLQCRSRQRCKSSLYEGNCVFDWWLRIAYPAMCRCGLVSHAIRLSLVRLSWAPGMALSYSMFLTFGMLRRLLCSCKIFCADVLVVAMLVELTSAPTCSCARTCSALRMWVSL